MDRGFIAGLGGGEGAAETAPWADGALTGEQQEQDAAEGIDVREGTDVLPVAACLLGSHPWQGADEFTVSGESDVERGADGAGGDAEVDDFRSAVRGDEDVFGFEVAVNDAGLVGVQGGVADPAEGGEFLAERDCGGSGPCIEGGAVDEFHGDPATGGALAGGENPCDGGVFEGRGDFGFPIEAEPGWSAVVPWGEELEGDGPQGALLDGAPDETEVAPSEEGIDDVSFGFRGGWDVPWRGGICGGIHGVARGLGGRDRPEGSRDCSTGGSGRLRDEGGDPLRE